MAEHACCQARDWVGDFRSYALAWGLPTVALVVTVFVSPPVRTLIWPISLAWMGTACLANARR
jgi:hypothetical protein